MAFYEIPLSTGAQSFTVNLGGIQYRMTLTYRNSVGGGWFLDMQRVDETDAILGIPLLIGIDLLRNYEHKGFGHLVALLDSGAKAEPSFEDMGSTIRLYWNPEAWTTLSGLDTSN